jgi:hypothetical protein
VADNTTLNTGSGGDVIATDDISGVKHQRVKIEHGADGSATDVSQASPLPVYQIDQRPLYRLVVPPQAVGANKVFLDLFNATGSGKKVRVVSAVAFPNLDTAVTGVVGVRLHLTRTSAVGTGGTTVNADDATLTNGTLSELDPGIAALPSQITARIAPSGGATAGAQLSQRQVFAEETNAGTAIAAALGTEFLRTEGGDVIAPENTGLRFVQGTVASVGSISFEITFTLE